MNIVEESYDRREQLIIALRDAVELEMVLMLQYLYAAYSIPNYVTGTLYVERGVWSSETLGFMCGDSDQQAQRGLRGELISVANEEMIHFLLANNLLLAVGGGFWVNTPDFSSVRTRMGLATETCLEPFSAECLERFIAFEAPAAHAPPSHASLGARYPSVSGLYDTIARTLERHPEFILARAGEAGGEHHLFLPRKTNKHHPDYHCQVDDLKSARFAIQTITEQGEGGARGDESFEDSHWQRFRRAREGLRRLEAAHGPARCYPCVSNPSLYERAGMARITNTETAGVLQLFNASFELSLQLMVQHYCGRPRATLRRSKLMNASIAVMAYMMAPLAVALMSLPSGIGGKTAGPSFELPCPVTFIPDPVIAQRYLSERFGELARIAADNRSVPEDVTAVFAQYAEFSKTLHE